MGKTRAHDLCEVLRVRRLIVPCSLAVALASIACDGGIPQPDPAKADAKESKVDEEALARRKAEREAKQRDKEEAEQRLIEEKQRLCVVPDPMPKDAPTCQQVAEAHDAYIRRAGDPDTVAKWQLEGRGVSEERARQREQGAAAPRQRPAADVHRQVRDRGGRPGRRAAQAGLSTSSSFSPEPSEPPEPGAQCGNAPHVGDARWDAKTLRI